MKRWMVTLGAMLLMPTLAAASDEMVSVSELREQVETMGRWQKTYQARGRTVEVDIPIIVPEVDEMPVMAAEPWRPFDEESWAPWQHITEIEERGGGEVITYYRCGDAGLYSFLNPDSEQTRMTRIYMSKYPMDGAKNLTSKDYMQIRCNSADVRLNADGKALERTGKSYDYRAMNPAECYAEDSDVSVGEAEQCLRDILKYYYGEADMDIEVNYVRVLGRGRDKSGKVYDKNPMGSYDFHFWQTIRGIPLMNQAVSIHKTFAKNGVPTTELERIALLGENRAEIVSRSEGYEVFVTLVRPTEAIIDDVPLLSAEDILHSIEKYIQNGTIPNVYSLRLGYVCYLADETTGGFILYPMWRVECDYVKGDVPYAANPMSDDYRDGFDFTDLYVNAQTGEVITDELTSVAQEVCPTVVIWKDVR